MAGALSTGLVACATSVSPIAASPRNLVLTLSQLPYPGFVVEIGSKNTGFISNTQAAAGSASLLHRYRQEGRKNAYLATFVREVSPQQVIGPVVVESSAVVYGSAAGAAEGFAVGKGDLARGGWLEVSTGALGQEAAAFTQTKEADGTEYQSFAVSWRQENVVNEVRIAGNAATLDLNYALTIARAQQRGEVRR
jgi:hypothetical protein